jgi:hypothetical protein
MRNAAFAAALLAACSAPPSAPAAPTGTSSSRAPAPDAGPDRSDDVLLATAADIDGRPGEEQIALLEDGTLRAGDLQTRVELPEMDDDYFWKKQAALSVVMLDAASGLRAILLAVPTGEGEDPPNIDRLFVVRGGRLVVVFDQVLGVYNPTPVVFPGDGTLHYVEQGWEACERAKYPATPVPKQEVVFRLDRAGSRMLEVKRTDTVEAQDCSQLSACPFVYAVTDAGAVRVGEILRDLRGARAYSLQSLQLPHGTTRVRLAEEKPEVSYLDEVVLEVDGVELKPLACRGAPVPAYCAADHVPYILRHGDTLDLAFDGARGDDVTLFARGYYVPE